MYLPPPGGSSNAVAAGRARPLPGAGVLTRTMSEGSAGAPPRLAAGDVLLAAALGAAAVGLVLLRAPILDYADETFVLYEAKRLLEGEVLYREVFEIITPLFLWLLTGAYALFGVHIGVARAVSAALQAGMAITSYAACRVLGVRPSLAALASAVSLAICQPFWPIVSPHWMSALIVQGLLIALLRARRGAAGWRWLVPGLIVGLLASTQQQKAVPFAAATGLILLFDALTAAAPGTRWRTLVRDAVGLAVGTLAVLGPVLAIAIAQAGIAPFYEALIVFPLFEYRRIHQYPWGIDLFPHPMTMPAAVRTLPVVLLPVIVRLAVAAVRRDRRRVRPLVVLTVIGITALGSIAYFPDVVHLAFIGGLFVIAWADCAEAAVAALERRWPRVWPVAPALATAGLVWCAVSLYGVAAATHAYATARIETAFGTIAAHPAHMHAAVYPQLRALVDRDPQRRLFVYPWMVSFYLLTDGRNPTPYQCMQPVYLPARYLHRTVEELETSGVPTVLVSDSAGRIDPILADYLERAYTPVDTPTSWPKVQILTRRE